MLNQLTISNFGLIDQVTLEFDPQLNILTGETGAGKSILIDALRMALGERANIDQIRDKNKPCIIETIFEVQDPSIKQIETLKDFFAEGGELIVQRILTSDGKNKIKINGFAVTLSQLKELGDHLVDFHGPHDHQMLLSSASHIGMLDRLVALNDLLKEYSQKFSEYSACAKKLEQLKEMYSTSARELDLLGHQIKELEQVPLDNAHYEHIEQERIRINNAERLNENVSQMLNLLESSDSSVSSHIRQTFSLMRQLNHLDSSTASWAEQLSEIQELNQQLVVNLNDYADSLSFEPEQAQTVNQQYDVYDDIKRKYGPALEDARKFYSQAKERFALLNDLEHNDQQLQENLDAIKKDLKKTADKITKKRKTASDELKKTIEHELKELGIANVKFESRVEKADFSINGQDQVTFYISPNAGEDLKPLAEIVSSGEAARVMLALKKALIKVDPIPVLIFDEIDAQIGGRLGTITGTKLREISRARQVILITHLPQIAAFADKHFKVTKSVASGRAVTAVNELDPKTRINEIAKMMSGEQETAIAIKHAKELIDKAQQ
ncbi:MAG: DNA repair protein RecN [Candidatus Omnitrophica bacterium]|nr:DNA repair protein RecN [Candidatus Omnitrophota bacterium]